MSDYKKIAQIALNKSKNININNVKPLNESILYGDNITERIHPDLESDLQNKKHSLSNHPSFPMDDDSTFEEKLIGERFKEVVNRYKRFFDCDEIDTKTLLSDMLPMVNECSNIEKNHRKELEDLAIQMVREEYDMGEDVVEIEAKLVDRVSLVGTVKSPKPVSIKMDFDNNNQILKLKGEVEKRRLINAMIQGAAKKVNHMFHLVDDKLSDIDPKLPNRYSKMMSAADYMYYVIPKMENGVSGGVVRVQFPTKENQKAKIIVEAMVFPVLIHELVKGVMELLGGHGLPKNKKIGEYVINKADYLEAEPWDMRLGPALWSKFTELIDANDFDLKHHIFAELVSLPVDEFNYTMKEIFNGTKEGKKIISDIVKNVKQELIDDELGEIYGIDELDNFDDTLNIDDLL